MAISACMDIDGRPYRKCRVQPGFSVHVGDLCIAEVQGVPEFGPVVSVEEDIGDAPGDGGEREAVLVRRATLQDQTKAEENALLAKMALQTCKAKAAKYNLTVRFLRARYSFDRSILRIRFAAEESVDLRDLVKDLVAEIRTRVEMEQIGVRDEAGEIGGVGSCGRRLCCCSWLRNFESVNVRMAKSQGLSLNPGSIGGCCGRLKCCLRFEYDVYKELGRRVPRQGTRVECPEGVGRVIGADVLKQRVKVLMENERVISYAADDVRELRPGPRKNGRGKNESPGAQRSEPGTAGKARNRHIRDGDPRRHRDAH